LRNEQGETHSPTSDPAALTGRRCRASGRAWPRLAAPWPRAWPRALAAARLALATRARERERGLGENLREGERERERDFGGEK